MTNLRVFIYVCLFFRYDGAQAKRELAQAVEAGLEAEDVFWNPFRSLINGAASSVRIANHDSKTSQDERLDARRARIDKVQEVDQNYLVSFVEHEEGESSDMDTVGSKHEQ